MQAKVRSVVFKVIIVWYFVRNFLLQKYGRLVCPASRHVAYGVSPTTQYQCWHVKGFHVFDAFGMSLQTEVETTQSISRETICPALQNDRSRSVYGHNFIKDRFEYSFVGIICHTPGEGCIYAKSRALSSPHILDMSRTRKEVTVLVKREGHDSICAVECLFDTIAVMNVNIDIEHACVNLEKFEYGEHDIIDVTKAGSFGFFGMMKSPRPIDGNVRLIVVEFDGSIDGCTAVELREFE
mmetsp:Transcript_5431/g.7907  ORF Transcript_5431/g.7907 Transcript_5431/m.7907 type:complete len:239 (+) Transcript_5431:439-1155(+)